MSAKKQTRWAWKMRWGGNFVYILVNINLRSHTSPLKPCARPSRDNKCLSSNKQTDQGKTWGTIAVRAFPLIDLFFSFSTASRAPALTSPVLGSLSNSCNARTMCHRNLGTDEIWTRTKILTMSRPGRTQEVHYLHHDIRSQSLQRLTQLDRLTKSSTDDLATQHHAC